MSDIPLNNQITRIDKIENWNSNLNSGIKCWHPIYEQVYLSIKACTRLAPLRMISVGMNSQFTLKCYKNIVLNSDSPEMDKAWLNRVNEETWIPKINTQKTITYQPECRLWKVFNAQQTYSIYTADGLQRLQLPGYDGSSCDFNPMHNGNCNLVKLAFNRPFTQLTSKQIQTERCQLNCLGLQNYRVHQIQALGNRISRNYLLKHDNCYINNMTLYSSMYPIFNPLEHEEDRRIKYC